MKPTTDISNVENHEIDMKHNKKELESKIRELLNSDSYDLRHDKARIKAMLLINEFQTTDELNSYQTIENNGVGFNAFDGRIMTSMCENIITYKRLSEKQMNVVRKTIRKYWRQLVTISLSGYKNTYIEKVVNEWEQRNYEHYKQLEIK